MWWLFKKHLVFSFNLMVVSTRSWSLLMLAPGKDLAFALLMLDLKHWGIWLWTCPLGAHKLAVLDNLWGCRVLTGVSRWLSLQGSPSYVICLFNAKFSYWPCLMLICIPAYSGIPINLNYKYILLGSLCYDTIKLPIELFDLVFTIWGCCIDTWMTVMLCVLTEIQISLLKIGVLLKMPPTTYFHIMNVIPYWCFKSSPQYQILCPSSMVVSPKPVHLTTVSR